ncbi:unnamed protein product [Effrenium voratum]|nr:unnamed protein product [Effrenium voratum]
MRRNQPGIGHCGPTVLHVQKQVRASSLSPAPAPSLTSAVQSGMFWGQVLHAARGEVCCPHHVRYTAARPSSPSPAHMPRTPGKPSAPGTPSSPMYLWPSRGVSRPMERLEHGSPSPSPQRLRAGAGAGVVFCATPRLHGCVFPAPHTTCPASPQTPCPVSPQALGPASQLAPCPARQASPRPPQSVHRALSCGRIEVCSEPRLKRSNSAPVAVSTRPEGPVLRPPGNPPAGAAPQPAQRAHLAAQRIPPRLPPSPRVLPKPKATPKATPRGAPSAAEPKAPQVPKPTATARPPTPTTRPPSLRRTSTPRTWSRSASPTSPTVLGDATTPSLTARTRSPNSQRSQSPKSPRLPKPSSKSPKQSKSPTSRTEAAAVSTSPRLPTPTPSPRPSWSSKSRSPSPRSPRSPRSETRPPSPDGNVGFGNPFVQLKEIRMEAQIGSGSFGTVWRASCRNRQVAVKVSERSQARVMYRELGFLQQLRHERLVSFLGFAWGKDQLILVMELMTGGSLSDLLFASPKKATLSFKQRALMGQQVVEGLLFLHEQNVVHRDLKTMNVILDGCLNCKICDFGLTLFMENTHVTVQGLQGSPRYMAPEQLEVSSGARTARISEKVDIWQLGCLFLELFCHKIAFSELSSVMAIIAELVVKKKPPAVPKDADPRAQVLIDQCLRMSPRARPGADTLLEALGHLVSM